MSALITCPRCGGDTYYEIGDVSCGDYTYAGARDCELCVANGDRAGDIFATPTGRIALPIAPAVLALNDDQGNDYCCEFYNGDEEISDAA